MARSKDLLLRGLMRLLDLLWYGLLLILLIDLLLLAGCAASDEIRQRYLEFKQFPANSLVFQTAGFALWVMEQPLDAIEGKLFFYSIGLEFLYNLIRVAILYFIRGMLAQSLSEGPFIRNNVRRLRIIAVIWAVSPQILNSLMYLAGTYFAPFVQVPHATAFPVFWVDYNALFIGFVLWLLADVFRMGVKIREDQDLTI